MRRYMHHREMNQHMVLESLLAMLHLATSILLLISQRGYSVSGRFICGWLGVVCAWSTLVASGRGWVGTVVAGQANLSGWLGATGRCAATGGVHSSGKLQ